ncbi:ubiquinol-cytochrome c reductase iron-sulfur subunit [Pseudoroseomonas rhizosphaerae]|uniref:Ubiquinol-cytochrome c reductase iron-sulfur subunit n=1 Tax=Teichococcus rhizosphaerae TaxID=1335062 RepID=A0A2C7A7V0_9PROT|nr:ubiquinol-cytochrome c reductase iron-sulfur subunit [Pseudoroseomonas rhizosphaerae]PHK94450.1 ubiquinol-cytochrome c reductase iron-sulfur subunit [Pseudoroseomonas rhizosphaerae]
MADTLAPSSSSPGMGGAHGAGAHGPEQGTKRDFLKLAAGSFAAIGVGAIVWPFIHSMNPAKDVLALASTDVNLAPIAEGQAVTVMWRGKPVFVRHRTAQEVQEAEAVPLGELRDPQADSDRVERKPWLVVLGVCTHLGCVPLGQRPTDARGDFGGWFCPCHGSHYDTSGRIRRGPAPTNLAVPEYSFTSDTQIRIG